MPFDMDLVRAILLKLEQKEDRKLLEYLDIPGYSRDTIAYHLCRLAERDLIVFEANRSTTNPERLIQVFPFELTWEGHEFLSAAKNETNWKKAKKRIAETVGSAGLDVMKSLLLDFAKEQLGIK